MAVHPFRLRFSALALALLSTQAFAQSTQPPTIEDLARRLQALEQRLGAETTTTDSNALADIDQRLRVLERKLELQAEEAAAKAAKEPVLALSAAKGLSVKSPAADGVEMKFKALVQADTLVVIGDRDSAFAQDAGRAAAAGIAGATLLVLPGTDHLPQMEAVDAFNRALTEHLARR